MTTTMSTSTPVAPQSREGGASIKVRDLWKVYGHQPDKHLAAARAGEAIAGHTSAVSGVSFDVEPGEIEVRAHVEEERPLVGPSIGNVLECDLERPELLLIGLVQSRLIGVLAQQLERLRRKVAHRETRGRVEHREGPRAGGFRGRPRCRMGY